MYHNDYERLSAERLEVAGFGHKSLAELQLPEVQRLSFNGTLVNLAYTELSNTPEADSVMFSVIPYSTRLEDDSIRLRLAAQQAVLGPDIALVGVQVYEPGYQELSGPQRKAVSTGSFAPFADRLLMTMELLHIRADQRIMLYGFSMGADVGVEAAYQNLTNPNRGAVMIESVGIFEPARVMKRGAIAVANTFGKSGKNLYRNVIESNSPALLEARGIDLYDKRAEKKHKAMVNRGVFDYNRKDVAGNFSILRGFGHNDTIEQINSMIHHAVISSDVPNMLVARMIYSGLTPREALKKIHRSDKVSVQEYAGDHSAADKLQRSGAFILQTAIG